VSRTIRSRSSQETQLAAASIKALRSLGYECARNQAGKRKAFGGGWINGAKKGIPDWYVIWPYIQLEFKDLSELSDEQKQWHAWARRMGIPVAVPRTVSETVNAVRSLHIAVGFRLERLVIEVRTGRTGA